MTAMHDRLADLGTAHDFAGAPCVGRWALFDPASTYEPPADVAERHEAARHLCAHLPARTLRRLRRPGALHSQAAPHRRVGRYRTPPEGDPMNTREAGAFRPGAQLAAQLLTGTVSVPGFDTLDHIREIVNEQPDVQAALGVLMLALANAVEAHVRLLPPDASPEWIQGYLRDEGVQLAATLAYLDSPADQADDDDET